MKIDSLAFKTDLFFHRSNGVVLEFDDFIVIKAPENPTFFWGNYLYFKNPPGPNCRSFWKEQFNFQFQSMNVQHMAFSWDTVSGEEGFSSAFVKDGFNLEKSLIMTTQNILRPLLFNQEIKIRPIELEEEWKMVVENHVQSRASHFDELPYRQFMIKKMETYRSMIKQKKGKWIGAFIEGKLVGDLGLFSEEGLGRFQMIGTHPEFRNRGVCSTLVYEASLYAQKNFDTSHFVVVADPDYHAVKIYESLGFKGEQWQTGLCKYNKKVWVT